MRLLIALAAMALATGCTGRGAPGEDDIRAALAQSGNRGGPKAVKLACTRSADKPGFVCDYRAPACNRYTGACGSVRPGSGRFVEANGRWQLVEDLTPRAGPAPGTQPLPGTDQPGPGATDAGNALPPAPNDTPTVTPDVPAEPPVAFPTLVPAPAPTRSTRPIAPVETPEEEDFEREPLSAGQLSLLARWVRLNTQCELGDRDSDATRDACLERDDHAQRMRRRGMCYGGGGRGTVAKWHRCD